MKNHRVESLRYRFGDGLQTPTHKGRVYQKDTLSLWGLLSSSLMRLLTYIAWRCPLSDELRGSGPAWSVIKIFGKRLALKHLSTKQVLWSLLCSTISKLWRKFNYGVTIRVTKRRPGVVFQSLCRQREWSLN